MSEATVTPPTFDSAPASGARVRRAWLRVLAAVALVVLGFVGWHYLVELPAERRTAAELAKKRAENARTISDLRLDLVWIAPAEFRMGTPKQNFLARWYSGIVERRTHKPNPSKWSLDNERPVTSVMLTQPFWLGRTEVTQAQWKALMGSNPSELKGDDLPVDNVSWNDAMEFCRKLTERESAMGRLPADYGYTLPREAQWEYACRAGTRGDYAGDLNAMAWYEENSGGTMHTVGTKQANPWGLEDMHGNVWEWCLDVYYYSPAQAVTFDSSGRAVISPADVLLRSFSSSGFPRVTRGGSWRSIALNTRSARRTRYLQDIRDNNVGLRIVLSSVR